MNDAETIVALGGVTKLAVALDKPPSTIANWKERGIPWRMRPVIKEMARRKRVTLRSTFLTDRDS